MANHFIYFTIGLILAIACYLVVSLHFVLASVQLEHDGDNLFFIPVLMLIYVSSALFWTRQLTLQKRKLLLVGIFLFATILAVLLIFFTWPFPVNLLLCAPIIMSPLGGMFFGFWQLRRPIPKMSTYIKRGFIE